MDFSFVEMEQRPAIAVNVLHFDEGEIPVNAESLLLKVMH